MTSCRRSAEGGRGTQCLDGEIPVGGHGKSGREEEDGAEAGPPPPEKVSLTAGEAREALFPEGPDSLGCVLRLPATLLGGPLEGEHGGKGRGQTPPDGLPRRQKGKRGGGGQPHRKGPRLLLQPVGWH